MASINKQRNQQEDLINHNIRAKEMLVIGADGTKYGVLSKQEALRKAEELDLDLVLIQPDAKTPVAKILDYSKHRFEQQKKAKEIKKNQTVTVVKEVQLSPVIQKHDFETKANNARKFLEKGNKVKVTLRFKGRMIVHADIGRKMVADFVEELKDVSSTDAPIKQDGRSLIVILNPLKENQK
ncbi:MAG: translation initiation factor IF-3 [bacterium]